MPRTKHAARGFCIHIDAAVCDGCGICVFFCKPEVFALSRELSLRGVYPALAPRPEVCTGCRLCDLACPQMAISLRPVESEAP